MAQERARPLSPHLTIWRWRPNMAVSIFHRVTGGALATVGLIGLVWWLAALAAGKDSYDRFLACASSPLGKIVLIGLSWAFIHHLLGGLRHFVLDTGAGYELKTNRNWSIAVFVFGVLLTAALWLYLCFVKG